MFNEEGTICLNVKRCFKYEIIHIALLTEQRIKFLTFTFQRFCLNFKSTFTILKELMNDFGTTSGEQRTIAASANMSYAGNYYKSKTNIKVTASNINIKIQQLFSKKQILSVCVTMVQWKISMDLTRTCF